MVQAKVIPKSAVVYAFYAHYYSLSSDTSIFKPNVLPPPLLRVHEIRRPQALAVKMLMIPTLKTTLKTTSDMTEIQQHYGLPSGMHTETHVRWSLMIWGLYVGGGYVYLVP